MARTTKYQEAVKLTTSIRRTTYMVRCTMSCTYSVLIRTFTPMDSTRQQKYNRLFQKEIGELFQREGYNFFGKAFVTVTSVRVSPDLGIAKIYLSIFGAPDANAVMNEIEKHNKEIRKQFGAQIRHQARIVPELKFFLDDSLNYVEKIEKLLKDSKPPQKEGEE
jgi:ribosome-binding factor A